MSYYDDIYNMRLNRYGENFKDRISGQRIADFRTFKAHSPYRVIFTSNSVTYDGVLQPKKQDETRRQCWLLTDILNTFSAGTIVTVDSVQWMIWYESSDQTRGYHRYCVLKMSNLITWTKDGTSYSSYAYYYGEMEGPIADTSRVQSRSAGPNTVDSAKRTYLIMPRNDSLKRQDYILINGEGHYVTGYDTNSTPGVEYFSLRQTYTRTTQTPPTFDEDEDNAEEFFFFNGGSN